MTARSILLNEKDAFLSDFDAARIGNQSVAAKNDKEIDAG